MKIFALLLITFGFNLAKADCLPAYEEALKKADNIPISGSATMTSVGTAVGLQIQAVHAVKKPRKSSRLRNAPALATGVGVAAGTGITANDFTNFSAISSIISLIRESDIGKGLYVQKLTREINNENKFNGKTIESSLVAVTVFDLSEQNLFCDQKLLNSSEIKNLVIDRIEHLQ